MSDVFDEDLDMTLPTITNAELMAWLDKQLANGVTLIEDSRQRFEAVQYGRLPRDHFSSQKFDQVKRAVALYKATRQHLIGIFGSAPTGPDEDMDEKFFRIIADFRRDYDLTKGTVQ